MDDLNLQLVVTLIENKYCREKDDYMYKNDRPPHQERRFFIVGKAVGLSLYKFDLQEKP